MSRILGDCLVALSVVALKNKKRLADPSLILSLDNELQRLVPVVVP
tara:strand:+ start:1025 stop:1162 length:138 start_codon:yes stop_codon:yes gene_type:complete